MELVVYVQWSSSSERDEAAKACVRVHCDAKRAEKYQGKKKYTLVAFLLVAYEVLVYGQYAIPRAVSTELEKVYLQYFSNAFHV